MIDTHKPMELLINTKWLSCSYVGTTTDGVIVVEWIDDCAKSHVFIVGDWNAYQLRNKPEPKRRPLNVEEMMALVGTVVYSSIQATRAVVGYANAQMANIADTPYSPLDLLNSSWRRLDGSGLWVEE